MRVRAWLEAAAGCVGGPAAIAYAAAVAWTAVAVLAILQKQSFSQTFWALVDQIIYVPARLIGKPVAAAAPPAAAADDDATPLPRQLRVARFAERARRSRGLEFAAAAQWDSPAAPAGAQTSVDVAVLAGPDAAALGADTPSPPENAAPPLSLQFAAAAAAAGEARWPVARGCALRVWARARLRVGAAETATAWVGPVACDFALPPIAFLTWRGVRREEEKEEAEAEEEDEKGEEEEEDEKKQEEESEEDDPTRLARRLDPRRVAAWLRAFEASESARTPSSLSRLTLSLSLSAQLLAQSVTAIDRVADAINGTALGDVLLAPRVADRAAAAAALLRLCQTNAHARLALQQRPRLLRALARAAEMAPAPGDGDEPAAPAAAAGEEQQQQQQLTGFAAATAPAPAAQSAAAAAKRGDIAAALYATTAALAAAALLEGAPAASAAAFAGGGGVALLGGFAMRFEVATRALVSLFAERGEALGTRRRRDVLAELVRVATCGPPQMRQIVSENPVASAAVASPFDAAAR